MENPAILSSLACYQQEGKLNYTPIYLKKCQSDFIGYRCRLACTGTLALDDTHLNIFFEPQIQTLFNKIQT